MRSSTKKPVDWDCRGWDAWGAQHTSGNDVRGSMEHQQTEIAALRELVQAAYREAKLWRLAHDQREREAARLRAEISRLLGQRARER